MLFDQDIMVWNSSVWKSEKYALEREYLYYAAKALALLICWRFVVEPYLLQALNVHIMMNEFLAWSSNRILVWMGYSSCLEGSRICIDNSSSVVIGSGCNGIDIYAVFTGFIVLFKGKWIIKLPYMLASNLFLLSTNILRIVALAIDKHHDHYLFYINHKYTYVFILYSIVCTLWWIWIKKFSTV